MDLCSMFPISLCSMITTLRWNSPGIENYYEEMIDSLVECIRLLHRLELHLWPKVFAQK